MKKILWQLKRILQVSLMGMLSQQEIKHTVRKRELNNHSYEEVFVIYKARPLTEFSNSDKKVS